MTPRRGPLVATPVATLVEVVLLGWALTRLARAAGPVPSPRQGVEPPDPRTCRVCGWDLGEPGWVDDVPLYVVCDCCGAETGVDDVPPDALRAYRQSWLSRGAPWFDPDARPPFWDLEAQLSRVVR